MIILHTYIQIHTYRYIKYVTASFESVRLGLLHPNIERCGGIVNIPASCSRVSSSNVGPETGYHDGASFREFPQSVQENSRIVA
jgi:hypothetical protein